MGNDLDKYQKEAMATAVYPGKGTYIGLSYVNAKLNGEAGEFSEHVGKMLRDDFGHDLRRIHFDLITEIDRERHRLMIHELGDILWYVAAAAKELGVELSTVAEINLAKLADRNARGVIKGSGSER